MNAEEESHSLKKRASIPLVFKFFGIGGPIRGIGLALGGFLAFLGFLLNLIGAIGGAFFNGLGNLLGTAGHLIGILANLIGSFGKSNFQLWESIKAAF